MIINTQALVLMGQYFEKIWGKREFLVTFAIVSVSTQILTSLLLTLTFAVTMNTDYLFNVTCNGLGGVLGGLVVAFKQVIPEHRVQVFNQPVARVKVKDFI